MHSQHDEHGRSRCGLKQVAESEVEAVDARTVPEASATVKMADRLR